MGLTKTVYLVVTGDDTGGVSTLVFATKALAEEYKKEMGPLRHNVQMWIEAHDVIEEL